VLRAEGDEVVAQFLAAQPQARSDAIRADWGEPAAHGRRVTVGGDFDGFYYARIHRR
jgi:16S rRNA C967 or C1407 C5-methylase (RsmB/RsmF family)